MQFKQFLLEKTLEDSAIIKIAGIVSNLLEEKHDLVLKKYSNTHELKHIKNSNALKLFSIEEILNSTGNSDILENLPKDFGKIRFFIYAFDDSTAGEWNAKSKIINIHSNLLIPQIKKFDLKNYMVHELRHALDSYKFKGKEIDQKYFKPRDFGDITDTPYKKYQSSKSEINARYAQAMDNIDSMLEKPFWTQGVYDNKSIISLINSNFKRFHISYLFPEKENSTEYKRLFNRAYLYIKQKLENAK